MVRTMKNIGLVVFAVGLILLSLSLSAKIIPSDGHWRTYNDPAIGSGINIRTQGDITMVTVFTYREDGSPVWYIATGILSEDGVFEDTLIETKNGESLFNYAPQSAEIANAERMIRLEFSATELGTLSIDNSEPKDIHSYRFGIEGLETELITTPLGGYYQFPDITGQWVIGSANDAISIGIDFVTNDYEITNPPDPDVVLNYNDGFYLNNDLTYSLVCPMKSGMEILYCGFAARSSDPALQEKAALLNRLYVFLDDIGMNTMTFHLQPEGDDTFSREHPIYQAFRLNMGFEEANDIDTRLFPGEGHWRTFDDSAIGSGINFHSQGDVVMMTVFTYNESGEPIWYMATGELMAEEMPTGEYSVKSWANMQMVTTKDGTPIESANPVTAEVDQVHDANLLLSGQQMAQLKIGEGDYKAIKSYQFGYPEFVANNFFEYPGEPLKFASPEGWWLMAEENGSESAIIHLVENKSKLSPPPPTDWTRFDNIAASTSWISSIRCPENSAYAWKRCQVYMTNPSGSISTSLALLNIGADTMRIYYRDENRPDIGDYPYYYFYYNLYRINPPMLP